MVLVWCVPKIAKIGVSPKLRPTSLLQEEAEEEAIPNPRRVISQPRLDSQAQAIGVNTTGITSQVIFTPPAVVAIRRLAASSIFF